MPSSPATRRSITSAGFEARSSSSVWEISSKRFASCERGWRSWKGEAKARARGSRDDGSAGNPEAVAAPLSLLVGGALGGDAPGARVGALQNGDGEGPVLQWPLPRPPGDAGRARPRGAGAGLRTAGLQERGRESTPAGDLPDGDRQREVSPAGRPGRSAPARSRGDQAQRPCVEAKGSGGRGRRASGGRGG